METVVSAGIQTPCSGIRLKPDSGTVRAAIILEFVRRVGDLNPQVPVSTVDYKSTPLPVRVNPPSHKIA